MQSITAKRPCKRCGSLLRRARGGACFCWGELYKTDPVYRAAVRNQAKQRNERLKALWPPKEIKVKIKNSSVMNPDRRFSQPVYRMLQSVRANAKRKGVPMLITVEHLLPLPKYCPMLRLELDYSYRGKGGVWKPNSPSVDRIEPTKGYVPGNVQILSMRANTLKSNATIEELRRVVQHMELFT